MFERASEEEIHADLGEVFRAAAKAGLELVLEEVLRETVGAAKWAKAKSRSDSYNGSYLRGLLTSMGHIEVKMPRARKAGAPVHVIGAYKRRLAEVDEAIVGAYVKGVSTRGMGSVVEALAGEGLSSSAVSRVTARLEERVEELRTRKLEGKYPYLFLDATYLKARWARSVESFPALIAYGVNEKGKRELLAVEIGTGESEETWVDLLDGLIKRGLKGVLLVISDAHEGIWAAVRKRLPEVPHQRCVVHLLRNVGSKVPHRLRKRVLGEVSAIFKSKDLDEAKERLAKFKARWSKELPEAASCLTEGFPAASQFFAFPTEHHVRIRTNNGLERLNREIKRRIKAIDSFPDRVSALRLVVVVAANAAQAWGRRRYLDMSLLDL
ncbi:MAG: IS256 family transposase [Pseudomonadota bacterium]